MVIGSLVFLDDWIIRAELSNALPKIFVRNIKTNKEEQLPAFADEKIWSPSATEMQKETNTDSIYISYSSPKTNAKTYIYNLRTKEKKFVKEQEVLDKNYSPENYITCLLTARVRTGVSLQTH